MAPVNTPEHRRSQLLNKLQQSKRPGLNRLRIQNRAGWVPLSKGWQGKLRLLDIRQDPACNGREKQKASIRYAPESGLSGGSI